MGLLNHVLVPCTFPGNPVPTGVGYTWDLGFTTTAGTTLIAVVCRPDAIEVQPWNGISTFKLDNGDTFQGLMGTTPQLSSLPGNGTPPNTMDNGSVPGVNIYWVRSGAGGATKLTGLNASQNFDCWIYEVSGVSGTPVFTGYSNAAHESGTSTVSTGSVDGGANAFYVAGCGVGDTLYSVNAPWNLDRVDGGGTYMCFGTQEDAAAAYMTGSGPQNCTFTFGDGPLSGNVGTFNAVIAAFPLTPISAGLLFTLSADQLSDQQSSGNGTAINSTYFTYGFVNSAKAAQNPLLGFHRKRYSEVQSYIRGSGQATLQVYPNYILKQDGVTFNPSLYTVPPIVLQTDPPDDIVRPLNISGNRVYVSYATNAVGAAFNLSKTIMIGVMDQFTTVNPNSG